MYVYKVVLNRFEYECKIKQRIARKQRGEESM
jgi:hypothetical protein